MGGYNGGTNPGFADAELEQGGVYFVVFVLILPLLLILLRLVVRGGGSGSGGSAPFFQLPARHGVGIRLDGEEERQGGTGGGGVIVRLHGAERDVVEFQIGLPFINPISDESFLLCSCRTIMTTHLPLQTRRVETWLACLGTRDGGEEVQYILSSGGTGAADGQGIGGVGEEREAVEDAFYRAWNGEERGLPPRQRGGEGVRVIVGHRQTCCCL